jgi:hypothetical protein
MKKSSIVHYFTLRQSPWQLLNLFPFITIAYSWWIGSAGFSNGLDQNGVADTELDTLS